MLELILGHGAGKLLTPFFLGLITLGVGYFVCIQGKKDPSNCGRCSKFYGALITIGAILGLVCVGWQSFRGTTCSYHGKKASHYDVTDTDVETDDASGAQ